MKTIKISCPGKIILMGEHGVVYGKPAIVAAVDRRMKINLEEKNGRWEVTARSDIPIGCGMGSSAAMAVIRAAVQISMFQNIERITESVRKKINEMAYKQEKVNHGNPSGVDNTICTYGGILWYQKVNGKQVFKQIKIKNLPEFVLINTGKPKETTKEMIELVSSKFKSQNSKLQLKIQNLFDEMEKATNEFLRALKLKSSIKKCLQTCERCLEELGVVGELAKKVVREIEQSGGSAKISGAGGVKNGSGVLLCYHENPQIIFKLAKKFKMEAFKVKLGGEGVKIL